MLMGIPIDFMTIQKLLLSISLPLQWGHIEHLVSLTVAKMK
jgi:hypothetical protein